MSVKVFVDTNIFVYAALQAPGSEEKRAAAIAVLSEPWTFVASTQVLNEFAAVLRSAFRDVACYVANYQWLVFYDIS